VKPPVKWVIAGLLVFACRVGDYHSRDSAEHGLQQLGHTVDNGRRGGRELDVLLGQ